MNILFLMAFGEENLEGKNDKNEISLLRSSLFKIYRFFSGIWRFHQLGSCLKSNSLEYKII